MDTSIYDAIGGTMVVNTAVNVLYDKITADPFLAPWFDGIDLHTLKAHQRAFLTVALGGPDDFFGRSIPQAHDGLAVTDAAFTTMIEHLSDTLTGLGLPPDGIAVIAGRLEGFRPEVVQA